MLFRSYGIIDVSLNRIVCNISEDLAKYCRQLIYWEFPNLIGGLTLPRHGSHITIANPTIHLINQEEANKWHGATVEFYYSNDIYIGGFLKGFVGFYTKIISNMIDKIKDDVILFDPGDSSLHLTLCSSKHLLFK